jgi:hypothetical protein
MRSGILYSISAYGKEAKWGRSQGRKRKERKMQQLQQINFSFKKI